VVLVRDLIRRGEVRERQAVLRVLPRCPSRHGSSTLRSMRAAPNVQSVFEAIACDNAYPARHFPDAASTR